MDVESVKSMIRRDVLRRRSTISSVEIEDCSENAGEAVKSFIEEVTGRSLDELTVMSYMSYKTEFPTKSVNQMLLDSGARLAVPYTGPDFSITACLVDSLEDLAPSSMGIPEPDPEKTDHITPEDADIILMPGVAFDKSGSRVGYGKGCYDRFLGMCEGKLPTLAALAWAIQLVEDIPQDENDIKCDYIFTENGVIRCH